VGHPPDPWVHLSPLMKIGIRGSRLNDRESFEAATARFAELFKAERCPGKFVWVWPEDILATGTRIVYVRGPSPSGNAARAREVYETAMGVDCGLRMADVCVGRDATYCCMWGQPEDHEKEPRLWASRGLMMSVKKELSRGEGKIVRSGSLWAFLAWWYREWQGIKELVFS
jgi:hypothetical protein